MHLRQYEIVQDKDKMKVDIQATCMKYKTIKQWAYILHDKDDTREHYHIYLNFGTGVDSKLVAEWFQLGYTSEDGVEYTGEQFIEKVKGRKADVLMYLTHENESQKYKHIYSRSEVVSNFNFEVEIENSKIIGHFDTHSYAEQLTYINSLPIDEKTKAFNQLEKLWKIHCQYLTLQTDRQLEVIFITGKGGTGKTFYAKKLLASMGLDYCISSSSNDPFQDYMGQNAIILDDLRDKAFINGNGTDRFEDLLKLLDNNTSSSVHSRFTNKVFNGNVIVITSSIPIRFWFTQHKLAGDKEGLEQLYRRISCYVEVTTDHVAVYPDGLDDNGYPKGMAVMYLNEVRTLKNNVHQDKIDFLGAFDKICDKELIFEQEEMEIS